jgi:hypothetical protein
VIRSERYHCQVTRDEEGRIVEIALAASDLESRERMVRVGGSRAQQVAAPLQAVLRTAHVTGRQWTRPAAFDLDPVLGAQVELLLRAVKPLRRADHLDAVAEGVARMSPEESSYWHAQTSRRRGLRALRVLLDGARQ